MKNKILPSAIFFLSFTLFSNLLYSQKFYLNYYATNNNNDSLTFRCKGLSDEKLQNKFTDSYINEKSTDFNATIICDNINRKFEKINYKGTTRLARVLVEGQNNLYAYYPENNKEPTYLVITPGDTLKIDRKNGADELVTLNDYRYMGLLGSLAKDFPEIAMQAQKVKYKNNSIQSYIYNLNSKYPDKENKKYMAKPFRSYLHFGVMAFQSNVEKSYMISIMSSLYKLDGSINISLRSGLAANYAEYSTETADIYLTVSNGITTHLELASEATITTNRNNYLELPVMVNIEASNWFVTPYIYAGFAPMFFDQYQKQVSKSKTIQSNTGYYFDINLKTGMGIKVKPTKNINLMAEMKADIVSGAFIVFGMDYAIKLNKH